MGKFLLGFLLGFIACVWAYELDFNEAVMTFASESWEAIAD